MRFRAKIVHVVVAGLPVAGCTTTESDTKTTPKTDTATKTTPDVKEAKETTKDPQPDTPKIPIVVVETPEDIPVPLGGVAMPYTPPLPESKSPPAPAPTADAPSAAAAAAPAAPAAIAMGPTGIELGHDHPPGEPCKPMRREEVEKALTDLKK
jgi:hypothetical protein